jgi:hypothetical protein
MKAPQALWPVARGLEFVFAEEERRPMIEALVREQGAAAATNNGVYAADWML